MNRFRLLSLLTLLSVASALVSVRADDPKGSAEADDCCAVVATCPVSGEELGSMGDPYVHVHKQAGQPDREVKFCCKMCLPRFQKDPEKYLAKAAEQTASCCAPAASGSDEQAATSRRS